MQMMIHPITRTFTHLYFFFPFSCSPLVRVSTHQPINQSINLHALHHSHTPPLSIPTTQYTPHSPPPLLHIPPPPPPHRITQPSNHPSPHAQTMYRENHKHKHTGNATVLTTAHETMYCNHLPTANEHTGNR